LRKMGVLPHLKIESASAESLGGDFYKVSAVIVNDGFLSTYISNVGKKTGTIKPPKATISGAEVMKGKDEIELDHLEGRAALHTPMGIPVRSGNLARGAVEWI